MKNNGKVALSNSILERRDARRKFRESLGAGASLAPRTRMQISLGSKNDWKFRLRICQSWIPESVKLEIRSSSSDLDKQVYGRKRYVGLGRDHWRSHFFFSPRHAPGWHCKRVCKRVSQKNALTLWWLNISYFKRFSTLDSPLNPP